MEKKRVILWFNNDLRLADHEALHKASSGENEVCPVYIFDPRKFRKVPPGVVKTGVFRAKFLLETVSELKSRLQSLGSDLIIRTGFPEKIIPELAKKLGAKAVYGSKEITKEEVEVEEKMEANLLCMGLSLHLYWQATLFHIEDIPWPIGKLPDTFTPFRRETEGSVQVRPLFPVPGRMNPLPDIDTGQVPHLSSLGLQEQEGDKRRVLDFKGGETAALKRVRDYFWKKDLLKTYKDTRNGLIGADYSSKLSPWMANGSLSPRQIYYEVKKYEAERTENDSTYWLVFELLWRDYFKFVAKKYEENIFKEEGLKNRAVSYQKNEGLFEQWREGKTGVPFIDANMRELNLTGFMSNRGRQNVASYLVHDLNVDWTWGAAYFESRLIDYDVCSNWLNWAYIAGVGNDPRKDRYFNTESQVKKYDARGEYVHLWLKLAAS